MNYTVYKTTNKQNNKVYTMKDYAAAEGITGDAATGRLKRGVIQLLNAGIA